LSRDALDLTTFDRYLLSRFFYAFGVLFVAALGLFVVVDGFTNLDGFQATNKEGTTITLLSHMGQHYLYQSAFLLELIGPTSSILSVMVVLGMLCKQGELHAILAAGIPTMRLAWPLVVGMIVVNVAMMANQEYVIPRISSHLQGSHGVRASDAREVEPCLSARGIHISGRELFLEQERLVGAEFRLPAGSLAADYITLTTAEAVYLPAQGSLPAGWLLKNASPTYEQLHLSEQGRQTIFAKPDSTDIFVATEVTVDQLYRRGSSFKLLSTSDLFRRLQQPASGTSSALAQSVHFHVRLTRPLLSIVSIFVMIPLIVRKEKTNLVMNVAFCMLALGFVFAASQAVAFLGESGVLRADLAAWAPVIGCAGISSWMLPNVRT